MVFVGQGLSYHDIAAMDLAEYLEAVHARVMFQEESKNRNKT